MGFWNGRPSWYDPGGVRVGTRSVFGRPCFAVLHGGRGNLVWSVAARLGSSLWFRGVVWYRERQESSVVHFRTCPCPEAAVWPWLPNTVHLASGYFCCSCADADCSSKFPRRLQRLRYARSPCWNDSEIRTLTCPSSSPTLTQQPNLYLASAVDFELRTHAITSESPTCPSYNCSLYGRCVRTTSCAAHFRQDV